MDAYLYVNIGSDQLFFYITIKKTTMGRGDKKTKKGKIFKGSFGKSRPANAPVVKKAAVKKETK